MLESRFLILVCTIGGFVASFLLLYVFLSVLIWCFGSTVVERKEATGHVVVTGGSSGIGLEVARLYLLKGMKVTIIARNEDKLLQARNSLLNASKGAPPSHHENLQSISCDVSSSSSAVQDCIDRAVARFGEVDILINCAGTSIAAEFTDLSDAQFEQMLRVNVLGSIFPTKAVIESMKRRGRGHVVFVSSQVAQAAIHGYTAYAASKWALRGVAEALQMEVRPFGVTVSVSYPPDTNTPGYEEEMRHKPAITSVISATGTLLQAPQVAADIVRSTLDQSHRYTISSGMDGFLLKQLHAGMTPVNNAWEVCVQIYTASFARFVSVLYLFYWQHLVFSHTKMPPAQNSIAEKERPSRL